MVAFPATDRPRLFAPPAGSGAGKWMPPQVALGFAAYRLLPCRLTARFALSFIADDASIDDPVMRFILLGFRCAARSGHVRRVGQ